MKHKQIFVDGIIGPTYHYGGMAVGNVLSQAHKHQESYPKKAALEGLEKMNQVRQLGCLQYVLPPLCKDVDRLLSLWGYEQGDMTSRLKALGYAHPYYLSALFSGASAWVANSCHITPSCDALDGICHITPANLVSCFHRHLDVDGYRDFLHQLFLNDELFQIYDPLPVVYTDEGMANTIRLSGGNELGLYLHVYGKTLSQRFTRTFPARQTKEAFDRICYTHKRQDSMDIQQSPFAIDAGVFHNDVIAFGSHNLLVLHEHAFDNQVDVLNSITDRYQSKYGEPLHVYEVSNEVLSLDEAVHTYFFNSQLILVEKNTFHLLIPSRAMSHSGVKKSLKRLSKLKGLSITVHEVSCEESIKNGGGPACLRFFSVLNKAEHKAINSKFLLTDEMYEQWFQFIQTHYPDTLSFDDLKDFSVMKPLLDLFSKMPGC